MAERRPGPKLTAIRGNMARRNEDPEDAQA
jgi:hypothetical protein